MTDTVVAVGRQTWQPVGCRAGGCERVFPGRSAYRGSTHWSKNGKPRFGRGQTVDHGERQSMQHASCQVLRKCMTGEFNGQRDLSQRIMFACRKPVFEGHFMGAWLRDVDYSGGIASTSVPQKKIVGLDTTKELHAADGKVLTCIITGRMT